MPLEGDDMSKSEKNKVNSGNGCVLIVDDEQAIRESLNELLAAYKFKVIPADSYGSAVKALEKNQNIEAVICDLKMPGKSGHEVLRYLNREGKEIPLIFLTGYGTLESCQIAVKDGAFDYILKPIDNKDKIIFPLRHAVEKYRLEKKNKEMQIDILHMAEEHEKILSDLLDDAQVKEDVHQRISKIVDKWKESD